jgi:hypothetical protein
MAHFPDFLSLFHFFSPKIGMLPHPSSMIQAAAAHSRQRLKPKWLTTTDQYSNEKVDRRLRSGKMRQCGGGNSETIGGFTTLNFSYSFSVLSLFLSSHYFLLFIFAYEFVEIGPQLTPPHVLIFICNFNKTIFL